MDEPYDLFITNLGFKKISTIVEYQRDLKHLPAIENSISTYSLSEGEMTEQVLQNSIRLAVQDQLIKINYI